MRNSFLPCSIMCLAFIILAQSVVAQISDEQKRGCEERARSIGKTLDAGDIRRKVIEEGKFGDCVHHRWMDILKELGLKRAERGQFTVRSQRVDVHIAIDGEATADRHPSGKRLTTSIPNAFLSPLLSSSRKTT